MMSFTGSGRTGSKIMEKASKISKVSLELGGKSPYIVLDDVDVKEAKATTGKVVNNTGQVCTAGTRILIPESKRRLLNALKEEFSKVKVEIHEKKVLKLDRLLVRNNLIQSNHILIKVLKKVQSYFTVVLVNLKD